jgi:hypothetical protein
LRIKWWRFGFSTAVDFNEPLPFNPYWIIVTKIFIDQWSIYGYKSFVRSRPHLDPIGNMSIIVLVIMIRIYVHALHHLPHLAHLLSHRLMKLLEIGSPKSLPVTNNVVITVVILV